jgi:hypothetical protein
MFYSVISAFPQDTRRWCKPRMGSSRDQRIRGDPWHWARKEGGPAPALYQNNGFTMLDERRTEIAGRPGAAVRLGRRPP